jgi:hypothetical protein
VSTVNERSPELAWTMGDSPLTSTVSATPPGSMVSTPTDTRSAAPSRTPLFLTVLNASIVTSSV